MSLYSRLRVSQLAQNVLSNYLTVVWMGGMSLALIPIYLRYLGPTQWGVVAICMALQALWGLLDAGLSQIMPRDIARNTVSKQAHVYRVYARAYALLGLTGFLIGQVAMPWLVAHWFNQGAGMDESAEAALRLVLVQFLFQLANSANVGYWNGREQQTLANLRQCFFGTLKHVGALTMVLVWRADALAYLAPFAVVSAAEWWINRRTILAGIRSSARQSVTVADLRGLAREAGVLVIGVLVGMLVSQVDRIVLSRAVAIESFGHYIIVANLGLAFMQLQYPLMRAFLPSVVRGEVAGDAASYRRLGLWVVMACVAPSLLAAAAAPWLLKIWLGNTVAAEIGVNPLRLILVAVAINAVYHIIYQRFVVRGKGRLIVYINTLSLVVAAPLCLHFAQSFGITAGGVAWLAISTVQLIVGLLWWMMIGARDQRRLKV